ncbi:SAM-dependent methyltransferase [Jatrophihabitans sp. DSM 45814]
MRHDHPADPSEMLTQQFWDDRYGSADAIWSGNPNPLLVEYASKLHPGTALDVGSGEGADAIWLASRGWTVLGIDISAVALQRAADLAAIAGQQIADRIDWRQMDLLAGETSTDAVSGPLEAQYDLVSAQFMHLPRVDRELLHQRLAAAVRPGGALLIVGHHPADLETTMGRPSLADFLFTPEQVAAQLDRSEWSVVTAAPERQALDPDGVMITITDAVLYATRRR